MADAPTDLNGCYLILFDGSRLPIKRGLARALRAVLFEQKVANGQIILHFKSGGLSAVETKTTLAPDEFL